MKRIISIVLGILFCLLLILFLSGFDDVKVSLIIIVSGILLVIGITAIIAWGIEYFAQFFIAMTITRFILFIVSPFLLIGIKIYLHRQKESYIASHPEKTESFILDCDSVKCKNIRYGIFVHEMDTIKRIPSDSGDLEIFIRPGYRTDTSFITWYNPCTYQKSPFRKNRMKETVSMGNISTDNCIFYYNSTFKMLMNENGEIIKVKIKETEK